VARRWVNRWHAMTKSSNRSRNVVRALRLSDARSEKGRRVVVVFSGGARKATEKSAEQDGDEGVTTMAGSGDFSPIFESATSPGAGTRM